METPPESEVQADIDNRPPPLTPEQMAVLAKSEPDIKYLACRLARHSPHLTEDIQSIIRISCIRAARTFDPSRGFKLITLARKSAMGEVGRFRDGEIRHGVHVPYYLRRDTPASPTCSLTALPRYDIGDRSAPNPADQAEAADWKLGRSSRLDQFWALIRRKVSPAQYTVLKMLYQDGMTHKAVGQALNRSLGYSRSVVRATVDLLGPYADELNDLVT